MPDLYHPSLPAEQRITVPLVSVSAFERSGWLVVVSDVPVPAPVEPADEDEPATPTRPSRARKTAKEAD